MDPQGADKGREVKGKASVRQGITNIASKAPEAKRGLQLILPQSPGKKSTLLTPSSGTSGL